MLPCPTPWYFQHVRSPFQKPSLWFWGLRIWNPTYPTASVWSFWVLPLGAVCVHQTTEESFFFLPQQKKKKNKIKIKTINVLEKYLFCETFWCQRGAYFVPTGIYIPYIPVPVYIYWIFFVENLLIVIWKQVVRTGRNFLKIYNNKQKPKTDVQRKKK